jgi:hypothetical protein
MSQKMIVSVCVGFLVVATGTAAVLFMASAKQEQSRLAAIPQAPIQRAVPNVDPLVDTPPRARIAAPKPEPIFDTVKVTPTNPVGLPSQSAHNPILSTPPHQARAASQDVARTDVTVQATPTTTLKPAQTQAPRPLVAAVAISQPREALRQAGVAAPLPAPPSSAPIAAAPATQPPAIAPKPPQSVEAVVVTGQRTQQVARTDVDSVGRGNSLTIQLPKRRP